MAIPKIEPHRLEKIARTLADAATHAELTDLFSSAGLEAPQNGEGPKWLRLREAFVRRQDRDGNANNVGSFIQLLMDPARHVGEGTRFEDLRDALNSLLAFEGLFLGEDGKLAKAKGANTISEAESRANRLRHELERRGVHSEVLRYCRPELLEANYFHATLEATKSVAQRIREKTGLAGDGAPLATAAFLGNSPRLAINTLRTETEQSEQKGFGNLLVGVFGLFRNPTAHAPRIEWQVTETDALDLLSTLSYIHRRLDGAVPTSPVGAGSI